MFSNHFIAASGQREHLSCGHWNDFEMSVGSEKRPPSDYVDAAKETQPSTRAIAIVSHKIDSSELFLNTREVIISHGSESYRLRLTSQNKLILTK
jgi:hemin uptake protein HemP